MGFSPTTGYITRNWMLFVDGENFVFRAQRLAETQKIELTEGPYYKKDIFVWLPHVSPLNKFVTAMLHNRGVRAYYYTSAIGDDPLLTQVKENLWRLEFSPHVFKKDSQSKKTKGVDITLTKDMLSHAFHSNFEGVVLIAGDADYVPLVEEVKRLGKTVHLAFFESEGLSHELRRSSDTFFDITPKFRESWIK